MNGKTSMKAVGVLLGVVSVGATLVASYVWSPAERRGAAENRITVLEHKVQSMETREREDRDLLIQIKTTVDLIRIHLEAKPRPTGY